MEERVLLERKTKEELRQLALGLGVEKLSALKKDEIIDKILAKREELSERRARRDERGLRLSAL